MRGIEGRWKRALGVVLLGLGYAAALAYGTIPAPYWKINLGICYGFSAVAGALYGPLGGGVSALVGEILGEQLAAGGMNGALVAASIGSGVAAGGMHKIVAGSCPFGKRKWRALILWTLIGQAIGFLGIYWCCSSASLTECFWRFFYNSVCAVFVGGLILMALQEDQSSSSSSSSKAD